METNFSDLIEITNKSREDKKSEFYERIRIGKEHAIRVITEGAYEKMRASALKGYNSADLYSFGWSKNKEDTTDVDGNLTVFDGNIRLLDLIKKNNSFLKELSDHFNKNPGDSFECHIRKQDTNNRDSKWIIYVSWCRTNDRQNEKKYNRKVQHNKTEI